MFIIQISDHINFITFILICFNIDHVFFFCILYIFFFCLFLFFFFFCLFFFFYFFFFFSSRRRHTRCSRDWSSDVCSSDLRTSARPRPPRGRATRAASRSRSLPARTRDRSACPRPDAWRTRCAACRG